MTDAGFAKIIKVLEQICNEPNYENFEYRGYKCKVRRVALSGCLCGYVGVTKDHPLYKQSGDYLECHGGITFSDFWEAGDDLWYLGFDTAHYQDFMPFMFLTNSLIMGRSILEEGTTYKDFNYVKNEVKKLVDELITLDSLDKAEFK